MADFSWQGSWTQGDSLPSVLEPHRDRIEASIAPYCQLQHQIDPDAPPWVSKYAGHPYLPKGTEYPRDPEGQRMAPVVQINFGEMPSLPGLPSEGLLGLFISDLGTAVSEPTEQRYWRLHYFPEVIADASALLDCADLLTDELFSEASFRTQARVSFLRLEGPCTPSDARFEQVFGEPSPWDLFGDDAGDEGFMALHEISNASANKIAGYASAEQDDPRKGRAAAFPMSLIQLSHDERDSFEVGINLFAEPGAVARGSFESAYFYWACD